MTPANAGTSFDHGPWTAWQRFVTLLAALAIVFDGFDIQILGVAIPAIMKEWHVARAAFAPIAALGMGGMAMGSPFAGYCGDRFGRRPTLIGCVLLFGAATVATAYCHTLTELGVLRTLAGMGIGGAMPNASALAAEFAPLRRRALAVTLTIVCVPLGGMIAGLAAGRILPVLGWHALYLIGGAAPLLFALVLMAALPESPRYLARRGRSLDASSTSPTSEATGDIRALLGPALIRDTMGLWLAFFACLSGIYLVFGWLPALLTARGLDIATASSGLASYNFGGVLGVLICAAVVTAFGSRRPLLFASAAGILSGIAVIFVPMGSGVDRSVLIAAIGLNGLLANAVQTTLYAVASHVYPTRIRATGVACAASVGRIGGLVSSLGGAAIIQQGGSTFYAALALAMAVTFIGLAIVRNHYPGRATESSH